MELKSFKDLKTLQKAAKDLLVEAFTAPYENPYAVILSGGSTPLPVYQAVTEHPPVPSEYLHIGFSDERFVPATDPQSNFRSANPMIQALELPTRRILKMPGEGNLSEAANLCHQNFTLFLHAHGTIPLGLLGIGDDGHTASLFNLDDIKENEDRYAIPIERAQGPHRISATHKLIAQIGRVVFLVAGSDKREMVQTLLHAPESIPAGKAVAQNKHVEIWVDREANPNGNS